MDGVTTNILGRDVHVDEAAEMIMGSSQNRAENKAQNTDASAEDPRPAIFNEAKTLLSVRLSGNADDAGKAALASGNLDEKLNAIETDNYTGNVAYLNALADAVDVNSDLMKREMAEAVMGTGTNASADFDESILNDMDETALRTYANGMKNPSLQQLLAVGARFYKLTQDPELAKTIDRLNREAEAKNTENKQTPEQPKEPKTETPQEAKPETATSMDAASELAARQAEGFARLAGINQQTTEKPETSNTVEVDPVIASIEAQTAMRLTVEEALNSGNHDADAIVELPQQRAASTEARMLGMNAKSILKEIDSALITAEGRRNKKTDAFMAEVSVDLEDALNDFYSRTDQTYKTEITDNAGLMHSHRLAMASALKRVNNALAKGATKVNNLSTLEKPLADPAIQMDKLKLEQDAFLQDLFVQQADNSAAFKDAMNAVRADVKKNLKARIHTTSDLSSSGAEQQLNGFADKFFADLKTRPDGVFILQGMKEDPKTAKAFFKVYNPRIENPMAADRNKMETALEKLSKTGKEASALQAPAYTGPKVGQAIRPVLAKPIGAIGTWTSVAAPPILASILVKGFGIGLLAGSAWVAAPAALIVGVGAGMFSAGYGHHFKELRAQPNTTVLQAMSGAIAKGLGEVVTGKNWKNAVNLKATLGTLKREFPAAYKEMRKQEAISGTKNSLLGSKTLGMITKTMSIFNEKLENRMALSVVTGGLAGMGTALTMLANAQEIAEATTAAQSSASAVSSTGKTVVENTPTPAPAAAPVPTEAAPSAASSAPAAAPAAPTATTTPTTAAPTSTPDAAAVTPAADETLKGIPDPVTPSAPPTSAELGGAKTYAPILPPRVLPDYKIPGLKGDAPLEGVKTPTPKLPFAVEKSAVPQTGPKADMPPTAAKPTAPVQPARPQGVPIAQPVGRTMLNYVHKHFPNAGDAINPRTGEGVLRFAHPNEAAKAAMDLRAKFPKMDFVQTTDKDGIINMTVRPKSADMLNAKPDMMMQNVSTPPATQVELDAGRSLAAAEDYVKKGYDQNGVARVVRGPDDKIIEHMNVARYNSTVPQSVTTKGAFMTSASQQPQSVTVYATPPYNGVPPMAPTVTIR